MTPLQLKYLYVNPAGECNLACRHCWVTPSRTPGDPFEARKRLETEFTPGQFSDLMREARELGLLKIKFTGSEPLLRSDFPELYSIASSHGKDLAIDIETNGTLIPPGLWKAFQEHPPDSVAVSLDSVDPMIHDSFRNTEGAWEHTVSFIRELERRGISTQVIMSLTSLELQPVLEMAELCMEIGAGSLKLNPVQPMGRGKELAHGNMGAKELTAFSGELFQHCGRSVVLSLPHALLPLDRLQDAGSCSILNLLGVLPSGDISFCGIGFSCSELIMGNFVKDGLRNIWETAPQLIELREKIPMKLEGICGNCVHRESCMGQCILQNYYISGRMTSQHALCAEAEELGLFPETRKIASDA